MSGWRFVLANSSGVSLGELRGKQRKFTPAVSATATASCQIRHDDPLWTEASSGLAKLKVYDSAGNLRLYGPLISDQESAQASVPGSTTALSASDASFELTKRFFAKDPQGVGTTYTATDSGAIAFAILASVNSDRATGISAGTAGAFVTRTATYLFKQALQAISELGAVAGSYEWGLRYTDVQGGTPSVFLDLPAALGGDKTQTVFLEYGTGKANCVSYGRLRSITNQATRVWALGSGSTSAQQSFDTAAEATYSARREDVVSFGDITVPQLLVDLGAAHVAVRKDPQVTVTLSSGTNGPKYGVDYVVGDYVTARVMINNTLRVNGVVRIWGATVSIDEEGNETAEFVLVPNNGVAS